MNRIVKWFLGFVAIAVITVSGVLVAQPSVRAQQIDPTSLFGSSSSAPQTTCAIDNVGWIVCPVLRSAAKAADSAFTFVSDNFLAVEVALLDSKSGTAEAWSSTRNIANILFVVAFLVVIYSLVTGRGVGNYNIKRMLPRFIIGAILVNVSYYICQILIDISNIAGSSIMSLFSGIARSIGTTGMPIAAEVGSDKATVLIDITSSVLGKVGVAWVLFAPLAAIVLSIAITCAIIIVLLIVRKTLIIALILLSPIAFVAYLLPNTEHYFSKWMKVFLQTLLLFPVIALLLGAGQVVSATIIKAGADGGYQVRDDEYTPRDNGGISFRQTSATLRLVAAGAAVLPLLATWTVFKAVLAGADTAALRLKQGSRRSSHHREDSAKKREQAAMDLNKKSMMLKGINRLQQINAVQDGDSNLSLIGRMGGSHRSRKKQQKSSEQMQFDQQVQGRLNELREGGAGNQTPQQVYSQALQRYQDAESASSDGQFNINSYEGIDLKASEAYLLESIGKGSAVAGVTIGAAAEAGGASGQNGSSTSGGQQSQDDKGASSHYDRANNMGASPSNNTGDAEQALKTATVGGGAIQAGKVVVVQAGSAEAEYGGASMERRTGNSQRPNPLTDTELRAKERAAKYLQQSQDVQEEVSADALLGRAVAPPSEPSLVQETRSPDPSNLDIPRGS